MVTCVTLVRYFFSVAGEYFSRVSMDIWVICFQVLLFYHYKLCQNVPSCPCLQVEELDYKFCTFPTFQENVKLFPEVIVSNYTPATCM